MPIPKRLVEGSNRVTTECSDYQLHIYCSMSIVLHTQWVRGFAVFSFRFERTSLIELAVYALALLQGKFPEFNARILIAHSHSMSGGSIWASLKCHCCFWIAGGLVSYLTMWLLTLQLFKNSIDTQEKLRLNLHSLSVSVSELLEYGRKSLNKKLPIIPCALNV